MTVKVKKFKKVKNHVYQVDMKSKQNEEKKKDKCYFVQNCYVF